MQRAPLLYRQLLTYLAYNVIKLSKKGNKSSLLQRGLEDARRYLIKIVKSIKILNLMPLI